MLNHFKYKAFISYSHADHHQTSKLFKRLETYRIPHKLRTHPEKSRGLGTFFRDRDELKVSSDLRREIIQALAASEFLIVLCSPDAAKSPWVNKEIIEFKRLHGEKNVLAVILRGEPFGSQKGRNDECFPEALRFQLGKDQRLSSTPAEPLAADFRNHADGPRLGFLKLAAALTNLDLAKLLDRDQQRKQRRVTAVTLASFTMMLVMGGLAFFAHEARQEADRQKELAEFQRAAAEKLVGYMVGPLTDNLHKIGRLEFLSSIANQVLAHYTTEDEATMSCQALIHKSRAYHTLNRVSTKKGEPENSLAPAKAALSLYQPNKQRCSDDAVFNQQLAYAEAWAVTPAWNIARTLKDSQDMSERERLLKVALSGYQRMKSALDKTKPIKGCREHYHYDISEAHMLIGQAYFQLDDLSRAEKHLSDAEDFVTATLTPKETIPADCALARITNAQKINRLADIHSWQSAVAEKNQDYPKALKYILSQRDSYRKIVGKPQQYNWPIYRLYAGTYLAEARIHFYTQDKEKALSAISVAQEACIALTNHEPQNQDWDKFCALTKTAFLRINNL